MSAEVIQKLQDKATVLPQERKKRGRTVPEELVSADKIRAFLTLASHPDIGPITAISFSENGYYLATAAGDSCIKCRNILFL
jgi:hypothetical protein